MANETDAAPQMGLGQILTKMREQAVKSWDADVEGAHWEADFLLKELARTLAADMEGLAQTYVREILEAFDRVPKWYA